MTPPQKTLLVQIFDKYYVSLIEDLRLKGYSCIRAPSVGFTNPSETLVRLLELNDFDGVIFEPVVAESAGNLGKLEPTVDYMKRIDKAIGKRDIPVFVYTIINDHSERLDYLRAHLGDGRVFNSFEFEAIDAIDDCLTRE